MRARALTAYGTMLVVMLLHMYMTCSFHLLMIKAINPWCRHEELRAASSQKCYGLDTLSCISSPHQHQDRARPVQRSAAVHSAQEAGRSA